MSYYVLTVTKDMRLLEYSKRLKTSRALMEAVSKHGLRHQNCLDAVKAAEKISENPLVDFVTVKCIRETTEGIWRNGEKSK